MSIFDKLTDTSLYTGAHKHRFDDAGRGRGIAGRTQNTAGVSDLKEITRPGLRNVSPTRNTVNMYSGERRMSNAASSPNSRSGSNYSSPSSSRATSRSQSPEPDLRTNQYNNLAHAFKAFAPNGEMDGVQFTRMCRDCGLIDKHFTPTDVDLLFAKIKAKGERRISLYEFESKALPAIARAKNYQLEKVKDYLLQGKPQHKATSTATKGNIFDKLTDTKLYTGAHQARFDKNGHGRGLAGRDMGAGGNVGHLSQITRPNLN